MAVDRVSSSHRPGVLVAVVIPYFQREAGLLSRAVASAFAQQRPDGVGLHVIVVDDGSPAPAQSDLEGMAPPDGCQLTLLSQANAGPAKARNAGLDYAATLDADFVALLDSDDAWLDGHVQGALNCLGGDFDFYFCDHSRDEPGFVSAFARNEVLQAWMLEGQTSPLQAHPAIAGAHVFDPDRAIGAFIGNYLAQTATVVYRFKKFPGVRFDPDLRTGGEDHLFWLTLIAEGAAVCCSQRVGAHCGRGVSVYYSALDWRHPRSSRRMADLSALFIKLQRWDGLSAEDRRLVVRKKRLREELFAYLWVRLALRGRADGAALWSLVRVSPLSVIELPVALMRAIIHRVRSPATFGHGY